MVNSTLGPVAAFVKEQMIASGQWSDNVQPSEAHAAYSTWAEARGIKVIPKMAFFKQMKQLGFDAKKVKRSSQGKRHNHYAYAGWKLKQDTPHIFAPEIYKTRYDTKARKRTRHPPCNDLRYSFYVVARFPEDKVILRQRGKEHVLTLAQAIDNIDYGQQLLRLFNTLSGWKEPPNPKEPKVKDPFKHICRFPVFNKLNCDENTYRELFFHMGAKRLTLLETDVMNEFERAYHLGAARKMFPHLAPLPLECLQLRFIKRARTWSTKK